MVQTLRFIFKLIIGEYLVFKDKEIIREVNRFHLALIMIFLWRINVYVMTKSYEQLNFLSNNMSIFLRVQFRVFSRVTLELIKLL